MTTILLARHGETDWNNEQRWQGHADQPLNEAGREQARLHADALAQREIDAIYSSDLLRAHETARIVGDRLELPVEVDAGLREVDVGDWAGREVGELEREDPEGFRRWQDGLKGWNGGESYEEMGERVVETVLRIAQRHPGRTLLVVTHGGSIRACRATAAGLDYAASRVSAIGSMANCEVAELRVADGRLAAAAG
ncbi:MAG: 2,3-bisphosphoglycerate-dependent phosphoglycerate mutase [Gaiellaceae bacterium]|nr:2,3-bisphosphoglycerate-dependent phosphoglycerate mutase [Gaiellaceae bacterium]